MKPEPLPGKLEARRRLLLRQSAMLRQRLQNRTLELKRRLRPLGMTAELFGQARLWLPIVAGIFSAFYTASSKTGEGKGPRRLLPRILARVADFLDDA